LSRGCRQPERDLSREMIFWGRYPKEDEGGGVRSEG
jgi:hypothetical protein